MPYLKMMIKTTLWMTILVFTMGFFGSAVMAENSSSALPDVDVHTVSISGKGRIDDVTSGSIVINDSLYQFSSGYEKYDRYQGNPFWGKLKKGMDVAFSLNKNKEIDAIWVMKK